MSSEEIKSGLEEVSTKNNASKTKSEIKEWIKTIIIAVVLSFVLIQFIVPTIVKERSMEPSFYSDDYLIISKKHYKFTDVKRGDVVVFESTIPVDPENPKAGNKLLIKRVIGLPNDQIDVRDGIVYINGEEADEDYIKDGYTPGDVYNRVLGKDEYFCMGDNRVVSVDSRSESVGNVKKDKIVGKVVLRLYPFDKMGVIEGENPLGE